MCGIYGVLGNNTPLPKAKGAVKKDEDLKQIYFKCPSIVFSACMRCYNIYNVFAEVFKTANLLLEENKQLNKEQLSTAYKFF